MRKFAFDWGNCLEVNETVRQIARRLFAKGHSVFVIPALGHNDFPYEDALNKIAVPHHGVYRVIVKEGEPPETTADAKVAKMKELGCTLLYDDNLTNLKAVQDAGLEAVQVVGANPVAWPIELKIPNKVYAFDVDECLETSKGPVTVQSLRELRKEGHIIGICGALCRFLQEVPDWHEIVSFTMNFDFGYNGWYNMSLIPKAIWLHCFQHVTFPGADEYIMVGNVFGEKNSLGHICGSHDSEAAAQAGWRFIKEDNFAAGER